MEEDAKDLDGEMEQLGVAVSRLPRPAAPQGLAARTLARIENESSGPAEAPSVLPLTPPSVRPVNESRRSWWLRRITSPMGRAAAALVLITSLGLMAGAVRNLDTAEKLGRSIETVLGARATDRLESFAEGLLLSYGHVRVNDADIERLIGGPGIPFSPAQTPVAPQPRKDGPAMLNAAASIFYCSISNKRQRNELTS